LGFFGDDGGGQLFNMTTDQIINHDGILPKEVIIEDKSAVEQMCLIQQLEDDDKQTIFKLIEKMLTNKKFKDFFAKNVAMLQVFYGGTAHSTKPPMALKSKPRIADTPNNYFGWLHHFN
jgi:hypothetical protein